MSPAPRSNIMTLGGHTPRIHPSVFVAPTAVVIGDVEIGEGSSVWFGAVLRGDVGSIRVGKRTNVQDLACIHMTDGVSNVVLGDDITIGHGALIHGATVGDGALIGMGSILLDNAVIGERSVIAAGSLVSPRKVIPPRSLVRGSPAKVLRECTDEECAMGALGAAHYVENAMRYRPLAHEER